MAEITSKIVTLELDNGATVELTLNFKKLLYLRSHGYEKEVNEAMKMIQKTGLDVLEIPYFLYAAYLCATDKSEYTQDEFIALVPWDIERLFTIFAILNGQKKTQGSKTHSARKS